MASFNKVILIGNLTRDPELRFLPKGTPVAQIGLAVNRVWTTESGEKKEEVTFVDVTFWGRLAETLSQYTRKGHALMIEGRLKFDQWDDKQTGQKRSKLSVVGESMQFLERKPAGDRESEPRRGTPAPGGFAPPPGSAAANAAADEPQFPEDDVPF